MLSVLYPKKKIPFNVVCLQIYFFMVLENVACHFCSTRCKQQTFSNRSFKQNAKTQFPGKDYRYMTESVKVYRLYNMLCYIFVSAKNKSGLVIVNRIRHTAVELFWEYFHSFSESSRETSVLASNIFVFKDSDYIFDYQVMDSGTQLFHLLCCCDNVWHCSCADLIQSVALK